jgi:hypothetical protein
MIPRIKPSKKNGMAHKAKLETHKQEEVKGIWKDKLPKDEYPENLPLGMKNHSHTHKK